jgi:fibrillarin-like pre-rRNA processing protein
MEVSELYPGVYKLRINDRENLATLNLAPGVSVYGEKRITVEGKEYRLWNPYRNKLAAALLRGLSHMPIIPAARVLYLGTASGTNCSHISDIVGAEGHVWGVEIAPRPMRDFLDRVVRHRANVSPILADARRPEAYSSLLSLVDVIYADVAQPDQASIVVRNARLFLKPGGWVLMAIKSRSVDVTRPPEEVYEEQVRELRAEGFEVLEVVELEPYERDHAMALGRYQR